MAKIEFEGIAPDGKTVRGTINAANEKEAQIRLRAQGFEPTKFFRSQKNPFSFGGGAPSIGRVSGKDLQIFTRQLSTLVNSGVHLVQSLELLARSTSSRGLKTVLEKIMADVSKGNTLFNAMSGYPKVFDRLYVNMVKAGEEGGVLDTVLDRLAVYIEKSVKLKGQIVGALWYPAAILGVSALVIAAILVYVIPQFQQLFANSGQKLPGLTIMVIGLSDFVVSYWYLIIASMIVAVVVVMQWYKSTAGRAQFDVIILKVPIFGELIRLGAIARLCRTLGTLISSGVPIVEALEIVSNVVGNKVIEKIIGQCKDSITRGQSLSGPFSKSKEIPDMVSQMIAVGEQTGAMDDMLNKVADFYEGEVDTLVGAVTSIIEPILMVFLGGIIAVLVIAMYLPIFGLAGAVGA